jgi:hypothetical protein
MAREDDGGDAQADRHTRQDTVQPRHRTPGGPSHAVKHDTCQERRIERRSITSAIDRSHTSKAVIPSSTK